MQHTHAHREMPSLGEGSNPSARQLVHLSASHVSHEYPYASELHHVPPASRRVSRRAGECMPLLKGAREPPPPTLAFPLFPPHQASAIPMPLAVLLMNEPCFVEVQPALASQAMQE